LVYSVNVVDAGDASTRGMAMFVWDPGKNQQNQMKHGIPFEVVARLLWDSAICVDSHIVTGEPRELWIGLADGWLLAFVITANSDPMRLISVRRATRAEERLWTQTRTKR